MWDIVYLEALRERGKYVSYKLPVRHHYRSLSPIKPFDISKNTHTHQAANIIKCDTILKCAEDMKRVQKPQRRTIIMSRGSE